MLNWIMLTNAEQLIAIKEKSYEKPQVLFKHSSHCGVSSIALRRLEKTREISLADFYFIDIIQFRRLSDHVAEAFKVFHESPQLLLIKNGECVYNESHLGIDIQELTKQIVPFN